MPTDLLADIDVVIHCAYDWTPRSWDEIVRVNIEGTRALLEAASAVGASFILISSVSAFDGTRQMYGRAKLACERITLAAGGNAVRLGMVYGGANGGMFGLLLRVAGLPVIPVFAAQSPQALIRLDNATAALVALAEAGVRGQLVGLASPSTIELGELMRAVSSTQGQALEDRARAVASCLRASESGREGWLRPAAAVGDRPRSCARPPQDARQHRSAERPLACRSTRQISTRAAGA